jgi:N-acetylmuramoyl-L-alanine amidase
MPRTLIPTISLVAMSLMLSTATRDPAWSQDAGKDAIKPGATAPEATRHAPTKCDRAQFRVILDVGHTAEAHGAMSARNVPEYDFNFELAWQIEHSLIADGFAKTVLLVTDGDARPSLFKRVAAANRLSANLFLSIHHDSVPDGFLENWEFDGRPSHFSDRFSGHSLFVSNQNPNFTASLRFGSLLGHQLKDRGLQYARHYTQAFMGHRRRELVDADAGVYRYDQLVVLKATQMPAVLLEAGSIINRDEELTMSSRERRDLIGAAVIAAVEAFCDARAPQIEVARHAARREPTLSNGK